VLYIDNVIILVSCSMPSLRWMKVRITIYHSLEVHCNTCLRCHVLCYHACPHIAPRRDGSRNIEGVYITCRHVGNNFVVVR